MILAAVAGILGLSVAGALREQQRLLAEFTGTTKQQVHASVDALSARLDALDQDTRMLLDLVERSRADKDADAATEHRVWASAFQALAVVVAQYRTIVLIGEDGALEVLAVDPTETPEIVDALMPATRHLAAEVSWKKIKAMGQPVRYGARSFLLYGTPDTEGGALVVASDAAIFLSAVAWTPLPVARLFVTDPASVVWSGCETPQGCRSTDSETLEKYLNGAVSSVAHVSPAESKVLGLGAVPAVLISERVIRPTGTWVVTWVASSQAIVAREQSLLLRIIVTAMAVAVAVAGVGAVILRQQRKAVALEGRLQYALALAAARVTSEAIVDNAPLGVLGISQDGRVTLANTFLTDRLGPITIGAPLRDAFTSDGFEWLRELEPLLLAEAPANQVGLVRHELRAVATKLHQFQVRIVPVRNQGMGVRAFALVEDRSELRSLENQLVRAEKVITVGVLSAGIAHEIGSPLAVIRGRAEQVLRHVDSGPRADDLRVIIKHIDQISSTIRQLLDFSRRQPIERRAVALDTAVDRARALLQWKLEARHLRLDVSLSGDLPTLAADPDQLAQVLVNLLLIACDASDPGTEVLFTAAKDRRGGVRLDIVDHGCGIAAEHMNAVFDPFFTTKKRGEGTGLGLSIVASIVRN
ncbi:MAG: two-component system, NtrC family, sensor histidine kinase HydH, partial [Myxococcales bacterium]|nr:two-component system, NtrC family, sensor histidine kinase HydH [Myxococcales bacterium]